MNMIPRSGDDILEVYKTAGLPFHFIFNFLSLREFEALSGVNKFFQNQKDINAPAFYNTWLSVDTCNLHAWAQINAMLQQYKERNGNEIQIKAMICSVFSKFTQRCGVRSIRAESQNTFYRILVSFYYEKSKKLFLVFWEGTGHVTAYSDNRLHQIVQKWQVPASDSSVVKTTINDVIYIGLTEYSVWRFFQLNLDGTTTEVLQWNSIVLKCPNIFLSGDKIICKYNWYLIVRQLGTGFKLLWLTQSSKNFICDNEELALFQCDTSIELLDLASGSIKLTCYVKWMVACADITRDKDVDLSFVICYVVASEIFVTVFVLEKRADLSEEKYHIKEQCMGQIYNTAGPRSVAIQATRVVLTLTNGTILIFNRKNMKNVLIYELFSSVEVANSYVTEDLHVIVGTRNGLVLTNQYGDEVEEQPSFSNQSLTTTDYSDQLINYTIQKTHYLYKKIYKCASIDELPRVFAEFGALKTWANAREKSGFLRWRDCRIVLEGFLLLENLPKLCEYVLGLRNCKQTYLPIDNSITEKLAVFPALSTLLEEIKDKHKIFRSTILIPQVLESCRNPTSKLSLSEMRKKITYVQSFSNNSVEYQEIFNELLAIENNLYSEFAQDLEKATSEGWVYVLESSNALQKEYLASLFSLVSLHDFLRIQPTMEDTLTTFFTFAEDSLTKENRELAQQCKHKLQEKKREIPQGAQYNIDTLGKKYVEALKRCKRNAETTFVKISEDDENSNGLEPF